MRPIVVYGATGFTGRLVARALADRDAPLALAGRDGAKLDALARDLGAPQVETRVAPAEDAAALGEAFRGASAVVSTAGPFTRVGQGVLAAAVAAGVPYADSTGEQRFAHWARTEFDALARRRGVAVVNMLAFEYALGDFAAALLLAGREARALHVLYRISHGAASAGTKKSILAAASRKGFQYVDGRLVEEGPARRIRAFDVEGRRLTGFSFAGGEALTVPRHARVREVRTYFAARPPTIRRVRALAPLARLFLRGPILRAAEARVDRSHRDPTREERAATRFTIALEAVGAGEPSREYGTGSDPYALTGTMLAEGAIRLARGEARGSGVLAPAEAFDAREFLAALSRAHPDLRYGAGGERA